MGLLLLLLASAQSSERDSEFELDWRPPGIEAQETLLFLSLEADTNAYANGTIFQVQLFPRKRRIDWETSRLVPAEAEMPSAWVAAQVQSETLTVRAQTARADGFELVATFSPEENADPRVRRWMAHEYRTRIHRSEFRALRGTAAASLAGEAARLRELRDRFLAFAAEYRAWKDPQREPTSEEALALWHARLGEIERDCIESAHAPFLSACARAVAALPPSYRMGLTSRPEIYWEPPTGYTGEEHAAPVSVIYSESSEYMGAEALQRIAARLDEFLIRETGVWIAQAAWDLLQEAPPAQPPPADRAAAETWFTRAQEDAAALLQADASAAASPAYATWTRVAKPEAAQLHDDLDRLASFLAEHRAGLLDGIPASAANAARLRESIETRLGAILEKLRAGREPEEEPTDEP